MSFRKSRELVVENKPFATITMEFYENRVLGVHVEGEGARVTQASLERCGILAAKRLQELRRDAFMELQKRKREEYVNGE